jgi:hypothetical protein
MLSRRKVEIMRVNRDPSPTVVKGKAEMNGTFINNKVIMSYRRFIYLIHRANIASSYSSSTAFIAHYIYKAFTAPTSQ